MERITNAQTLKMQVQTGATRKRVLSFDNFAHADQDSLLWYDLLPGDGASVSGIPDTRSPDQLRDELLSAGEAKAEDIDLLAACLLGRDTPLEPRTSWQVLARHLSRIMAGQLTASGNRSLRMRAQRLNYYIEALTACRTSEADKRLVIAERTLMGMKPWDFLEYQGARWWVSSGAPNIYRDDGTRLEHWTAGLPTQIDPLPDGSLSAGSIYSKGAFLYGANGWSTLPHRQPVPLVFEYGGTRYFLDHYGEVWRDIPRHPVGRVPCRQVHFARHFNGILYCLDNSEYGKISLFDMASGSSRQRSVLPVQVCNDIAITGEWCYLIDKQQGSVFKFDPDFTYVSRALAFGRGEACLLDPVGLRIDHGRLLVTSWLANKVTVLHCF